MPTTKKVKRAKRSAERKKENKRKKAKELDSFKLLAKLTETLPDSAFPDFDGDLEEEPQWRAQDMIYDAWDSDDSKTRISLARKALEIYPECADAYLILAQDEAASQTEEILYLEQGVAAGEKSIGSRSFKKDAGYFWGIFETRPYMRVRFELANCLRKMGLVTEAVDHYRDLLRLNPNDNQGLRFVLAACYLEDEKYEDLRKLIHRYKGDYSAEWAYTSALLAFLDDGDRVKSRKLLKMAIQRNSYVSDYLTGRKKIPDTTPEYITVGEEDEAYCLAGLYQEGWGKIPGALDWLRSETESY